MSWNSMYTCSNARNSTSTPKKISIVIVGRRPAWLPSRQHGILRPAHPESVSARKQKRQVYKETKINAPSSIRKQKINVVHDGSNNKIYWKNKRVTTLCAAPCSGGGSHEQCTASIHLLLIIINTAAADLRQRSYEHLFQVWCKSTIDNHATLTILKVHRFYNLLEEPPFCTDQSLQRIQYQE
jgi:hypothetical protein